MTAARRFFGNAGDTAMLDPSLPQSTANYRPQEASEAYLALMRKIVNSDLKLAALIGVQRN
jgi:hypothetical protein